MSALGTIASSTSIEENPITLSSITLSEYGKPALFPKDLTSPLVLSKSVFLLFFLKNILLKTRNLLVIIYYTS